MKRRFTIAGFVAVAAMAGGFVPGLRAGDDSPKQLPAAVSPLVSGNLGGGHIDDIKVIRIDERLLYVVEIDLPGPRKRKVHVTGEGVLLKIVDKQRLPDLPAAIRTAMAPILADRGRFDGADKVTVDGKVEYHLEFDLPGRVELLVVFSETGEVISRREEADL